MPIEWNVFVGRNSDDSRYVAKISISLPPKKSKGIAYVYANIFNQKQSWLIERLKAFTAINRDSKTRPTVRSRKQWSAVHLD